MDLEEAEEKSWRPRGQGCGWLNTMSGQGKCYPSVGKTQKVQCRVETCKQEIASQNYERHLRRFHPSENPKILRPYGQKVFSFGIEKAPAPPSNEDTGEDKESCAGEDQVAGKGKEGDINENYIDTLVSEAPAAGGDDDIIDEEASRSSDKSGMKRPRLEAPEEAAAEDLIDVTDYLAGIEETIDSILALVPLNISINYHKKRKDRIKLKLIISRAT